MRCDRLNVEEDIRVILVRVRHGGYPAALLRLRAVKACGGAGSVHYGAEGSPLNSTRRTRFGIHFRKIPPWIFCRSLRAGGPGPGGGASGTPLPDRISRPPGRVRVPSRMIWNTSRSLTGWLRLGRPDPGRRDANSSLGSSQANASKLCYHPSARTKVDNHVSRAPDGL